MGTFVRKDSASSRKPGADADTPGQAWGFGVGLRADAWAGGPASSSPARPCPRPVVPASWSSAGGQPFLPGAQGSARTPTRALATSPPDAAASESRPAPPGRAMPRAGSLWIVRPRCSSAALANRTHVRCRPPCSLSARQTFFPRRGQSVAVQKPTATV